MIDPGRNRRLVSVRVNGELRQLDIDLRTTLLELLRQDFELTGAKLSCGEQRCGACTVLVAGLPVSACTYLAFEADGEEVLTVEGLAADGELNSVQQAFVDEGAVQCGFCTPGMIMVARALLNDVKDPTDQGIRDALSGNICRCTGYEAIERAIRTARDEELGK